MKLLYIKPLKADYGSLVSVTQASQFSLHIVHNYSSFPPEEIVLRGLVNITRHANLAELSIVPVSGIYPMI